MANRTKVGIVGLGMIGGSLALALRERYTVLGFDTDPATCEIARRDGYCEVVPPNAMSQCKVVFCCVPVFAMKKALSELSSILGDGTILTDVASVKLPFEKTSGRYVGGHPMAGTERGGINSSKPHLFENAYWVITDGGEDADTVCGIVSEIGAKPLRMTAEEHDRAVSVFSHVPHAAAYALSQRAADADVPPIAGSGFLDTTRIAQSDARFWTDVFLLNAKNVTCGIANLVSELSAFSDLIARGERQEIYDYLSSARQKRLALSHVDLGGAALYVDLIDRVGEFERVTSAIAAAGINVANIALVPGRDGASGALRLEFDSEADRAAAKEILEKSHGKCDAGR